MIANHNISSGFIIRKKEEYLRIVDKCTLEVSSGIKSYSESLSDSLNELGNRGISGQKYQRPNGKIVSYNVEGLVRRDTISSVYGIANRALLEEAKASDSNYVYVSQHLGVRTSTTSKIANHAGWQGKIYMLDGSNEKYGNFYEETGAGTVEGFGGVNCRHRVVSAYEGMKIPEELDLEKNAEIENKEKHQRYLERGVRAWKRKEFIFKASGNEEEYKKAHLKVEEWSNKLDQFTKDNGLRRDYVREQIADTVNNKNDINNEYYDVSKNLSKNTELKNEYIFKNKIRKELRSVNDNVAEADNKVSKIFSKEFKGYKPSPLVDGPFSECSVLVSKNKNGTYKYEISIVNTALPPTQHVNIGNYSLANSIHERTHDLVNQIAMKRAGIKDLNNVTVLQDFLFKNEHRKLGIRVYEYCFKDESVKEIEKIIRNNISERATHNGHEFISESMVSYFGEKNPPHIAKKVYNYLIEEWKK